MKYRRFSLIIVVILFFNLMAACTQASISTPTGTATLVPVTPTNTAKPTSTPKPTATLNVAATKQYEDFFSQVEGFKDQGYIPDTKGTYVKLQDFNESWAQLGWFRWWHQDFDINITNFVLDAHFSWESASAVSENSGCGIVFALQEDGKNYSVFLDKSRIYFTRSDADYYYELGKIKGTGRVQFENPAEADFSLLVFETQAYAFVDRNFIGEYSLSKDQPLKGKLAYSLLSGTNKDYGTRCEITNSQLWVLTP
jgi:hypothetical protein